MKRINWEHPESLVTLRSPGPFPSPRDCAEEGRSYGDVTATFSRLDKLTLFLINGASCYVMVGLQNNKTLTLICSALC